MIVRRALFEDFAPMLRMAQDFVAEHPHGVDLSETAFRGLFEHALAGNPLSFWVALDGGEAVGMMGALRYPLFFNPAMGIAQELFIWVDPQFRGSDAAGMMLSEFENWARDTGAHRVLLTSPHNDRIEAVERLYRAKGFAPMERTFYKDI